MKEWTQMDLSEKLDDLNERLLAFENIKPAVKEPKAVKPKAKSHGKRS